MHYFIRRYRCGLWKLRRWLPLVFLPSVAFLLVVSAIPDRFSVTQMIAVHSAAPIALSRTPVDVVPMGEMASSPAGLFLDDFAILELIKNVDQADFDLKKDPAARNLRGVIESSMSLKTVDDAHVLLSYYGHDPELGKMLVNYYTLRLIGRTKDGLARSVRNLNRASVTESGGPPRFQPPRNGSAVSEANQPGFSQAQPALAEGELGIQQHRTFFRFDRLFPAALILFGALVIMFVLAGVVEWMDLSFKSERQVARYLNIPVIGVIPDLDPLSRRLQ